MDRIETGNTLRQAVHEIQYLRKQNEILSAQMFVVQVFAKALGMDSRIGMSLDVVPKLEQLEHELDMKLREQDPVDGAGVNK